MKNALRLMAALALAITSLTIFGSGARAATCTSNCLQPGDYTVATISGGIPRTYLVHVPASYNGSQAVPLLLDIHGFSSYAADERKYSGQLEESDARGFIAVWPEGIGLSWNAYGCCAAANAANLNDVAFLRQVIGQVKQRANIDSDRVFVTGISNGGGMAQRMACEAADLVRAVAAVSFPLNNNAPCNPAKPIGVTEIAGTADSTIAYAGSSPPLPGLPNTLAGVPLGVQSAAASLEEWKRINGCTDAFTQTQLHPEVSAVEYGVCNSGVKVGLVTIVGGKHVLYQNYVGLGYDGTYAPPLDVAPYIWDHIFNI